MENTASNKRYRCIFHSKPAPGLPEGVKLMQLNFPNWSNSSMVLKELVEEIDGQQISTGVEFRVDIDADSVNDAIVKAGNLADGIASHITLVTGVGAAVVRPMLCFGITDNETEHDFMQFFDNAHFFDISRKRLDTQQFLTFATKLHELQDANLSERISRAMRWYRLGKGIADIFERFNAYWIGIEALNPVLQEKLGVDDDKTTCPECKHQWKPVATVSGIREFCKTNITDGEELYKRIHSLRISLMHSTTTLEPLIREASSLIVPISNILLGAISFLLDISKPWLTHPELMTNSVPSRMEIDGKVQAKDIKNSEVDPHFVDSHILVKVDALLDGRRQMTIKSNFTSKAGKGVTITVEGFGIYGEGKIDLHVQSTGIRN